MTINLTKISAGKTKWLRLCVILGVLALFAAAPVSTVYASDAAPVEHQQDSTEHSASVQTHKETRTVNSILPFVVVLIPFLSVFGLTQISEEQSLKYTAFATLACFISSLFMIPAVLDGEILQFVLDTGFSMMSLAFFADSTPMATQAHQTPCGLRKPAEQILLC